MSLELPASLDLPDYILATGALGTAAFAIVDASKSLWGGVSNAGFGHIKRVVKRLFPSGASAKDISNPLALGQVLATLRANWLNGTALADQKSIAKTLIRLRLDKANAGGLATATGVDATLLNSVAEKIVTGTSLTQPETDVLGRFDMIVTTLLDEGYQRADQQYRDGARALSVFVALVLAFFGGWQIGGGSLADYLTSRFIGAAMLTGLIATPLAPVAKDLADGLTTAMKALGSLRK
jgi:hypothetical protein